MSGIWLKQVVFSRHYLEKVELTKRAKQEAVKDLKPDWLLLSLLTLLKRKLLNYWSNGKVLNPVASKTLKILSVPMVITITLLVKKGE